MDRAVYSLDLEQQDIAFLQKIEGGMPIVADISRADLILYTPRSEEEVLAAAQARPHSVPPIHPSLEGRVASRWEQAAVFRTLEQGRVSRSRQGIVAEGAAPIVQEVHPVLGREGRVIAALSFEKTMIEEERHKRRSPAFQEAVERLQSMLLRGVLEGAEHLSPFGEHDGLLFADGFGRIRYLSGIANNLYRRLGYMENLVGKSLDSLETADRWLVRRALSEGRCIEEESKEENRIWRRKLIPLLPDPYPRFWDTIRGRFNGYTSRQVLVVIHDATMAQRREQELKVKSAMIREVHHRVKNNLQTIAALLRLQARRSASPETRRALRDSLHRILSVAVVHEYLSQEEDRIVNLRDVARRVIEQLEEGVVDPEKRISLRMGGPNIYLPAQQATACALVINELLQNSLEHGYERRREGTISVELKDKADQVTMAIEDDGRGLPEDFNLGEDSSLGLRIVRTLVEEDLKGTFELESGRGVRAIISFPKTPLVRDENWEESE